MSIARHHAEWLSLLEISGPFLSMPVLLQAFPQGLDALDPEVGRELRAAYEEWADNQAGLRPDPALHTTWIRYVLGTVLELPAEIVAEGQAIPEGLKVPVPEHAETLRPDLVIIDLTSALTPRLLIQTYPPSQDLEKSVAGSPWQASPGTRMMMLLRATGVRLGLVTNGEQWLLVDAPADGTTGFTSWYAALWLEEPLTLRAFRSLLGVERFFNVPEAQTLAALLAASARDQQEVTDQLGYQVRRAVEILIQAIDRADQDRGRALLAGLGEPVLYEAALTVMMRLVFLLTAEERKLLPLDDPFYSENYAVATLRAQQSELADRYGEELLEYRYDAWSRLLATFRVVHGGLYHDRLTLPAYGGSLFDPDRFPFLEGRTSSRLDTRAQAKEISHQDAKTQSKKVNKNLSGFAPLREAPLPINNRTVLHLLNALQLLQVKVPGGGPAEARRLSFRALDIEQIGHVYESLLDHTAVRAAEPVLGLAGTKNQEPEVPLRVLEEFTSRQDATRRASETQEKEFSRKDAKTQRNKDKEKLGGFAPLREPPPDLLDFLKDQTGRSESALRKALINNSQLDIHNSQLLSACGNDDALYRRVLPWAGLIRADDFGQPVVIPAGSVYVTAGAERRATGTHYTPKALTEPIVQHTLEPLVYKGPADGLPREKWRLRPPADLLDLKVCDMAMGSGAFLVQACRYLSERLVEAWETAEKRVARKDAKTQRREKNKEKLSGLAPLRESPAPLREVLITPEGRPTTNPDEALPADTTDRLILARRLVADRCLYGVDKNPLAVEMAKLSLWLITLDKNRPFTFLDHALKCGDSLVGVNLDQLVTWSLEGKGERRFETMTLQAEVDWMVKLRRRLEAIPVNTVIDQAHKRVLFLEAEQIANDLRAAADMLIASYFNDLKADEQERLRYDLLLAAREGIDVPPERASQADLGTLRPFHWSLEFPEVFLAEGRSGFDAFVGNPPFIGGRRIRETLGDSYRELLYQLYPGSSGNADYSAFFFLRGFRHLQQGGTLGLIATNTIAQGDTRQSGLEKITEEGGTIYNATNGQPWPGLAAVVVSIVHLTRESFKPLFILDGKKVEYISSLLDSRRVAGEPHPLVTNQNRSFQGSLVVGMGFVLSPEEAQVLVEKNARNREVLFPYLNGQDLNNSPDQSPTRWVINFFDWPLKKAQEYTEPMAILREKVYPVRTKVRREAHRKYWWHYGDKRPALYKIIAPLKRVLVVARVSKTVAFVFVPIGWIYNEKVVVFPFDEAIAFTVLQSTIHGIWAWKYSSTLKSDLNYAPRDCFETFPFPNSEPRTLNSELETIGETYHEHRRQIMLTRQEGLTATYNRFHNPEETAADIAKLRELHVQMDRAVAAAYGWDDLPLDHGFHDTPQGLRFTISEAARREVLGRLLALNHLRYEEEVLAGLHDAKRGKKGSRKVAKSQSRKNKKDAEDRTPAEPGPIRGRQGELPGLEENRPKQLGLFGEQREN